MQPDMIHSLSLQDAAPRHHTLAPIHTDSAEQAQGQRRSSRWNMPHANANPKPDMRSMDPGSAALESDPMFRTENFMMYGFKVAMCTKQGRHPWGDCPYAHPTENARRRDPRVFSYSCVECPAYRNGGFCANGDQCEFSHGVFEARLHPDSFRTVACKEGSRCRRKVCFFYHTEAEKRCPTGLQDARAQLAAEMGTAALDMDVDTMRSVANSILAGNPSLAGTIKSMSHSTTPVSSHQALLSSVLSGAHSNSAPLTCGSPTGGIESAKSGGLSRMLSSSAAAAAAAETVAPCMKGANKNRVLVKELAAEVAVHPDALMHSLRAAAIQGELEARSSAPSAEPGSLPEATEAALQRLAAFEGCAPDKLRGWLLRVPGVDPFRKAGRAGASIAAYDPNGGSQANTPPIRAHFGEGANGGCGNGMRGQRRSGWDVQPPPTQKSGGLTDMRSRANAPGRW